MLRQLNERMQKWGFSWEGLRDNRHGEWWVLAQMILIAVHWLPPTPPPRIWGLTGPWWGLRPLPPSPLPVAAAGIGDRDQPQGTTGGAAPMCHPQQLCRLHDFHPGDRTLIARARLEVALALTDGRCAGNLSCRYVISLRV